MGELINLAKLADYLLGGILVLVSAEFILSNTQRVKHHKITKASLADSHYILNMSGALIGTRPSNHPDIQLALKTKGLQVKYPDGRVDSGRQS